MSGCHGLQANTTRSGGPHLCRLTPLGPLGSTASAARSKIGTDQEMAGERFVSLAAQNDRKARASTGVCASCRVEEGGREGMGVGHASSHEPHPYPSRTTRALGVCYAETRPLETTAASVRRVPVVARTLISRFGRAAIVRSELRATRSREVRRTLAASTRLVRHARDPAGDTCGHGATPLAVPQACPIKRAPGLGSRWTRADIRREKRPIRSLRAAMRVRRSAMGHAGQVAVDCALLSQALRKLEDSRGQSGPPSRIVGHGVRACSRVARRR